jgi:hypothetical protein
MHTHTHHTDMHVACAYTYTYAYTCTYTDVFNTRPRLCSALDHHADLVNVAFTLFSFIQ